MVFKISCSICGVERSSEDGECVNCGSKKITKYISSYERISIEVTEAATIAGKVKKKVKKRWAREFKFGDDFNWGLGKYVYLNRDIDRENNLYFEVVIDKQTGEILRECLEPLDEHYGHGNAKKTKE